jgi:hypothetical protein
MAIFGSNNDDILKSSLLAHRFTDRVELKEDYTLAYHVAKEEAYPAASTTEMPTTSTTSGGTDVSGSTTSTVVDDTTTPSAGVQIVVAPLAALISLILFNFLIL